MLGQSVFIYGAGGAGREVLGSMRASQEFCARFDGFYFIDNYLPMREVNGVEVFTFEEALARFRPEEMRVHIAIDEPATKLEVYEQVISHNLALEQFIGIIYVPEQFIKFGAGVFTSSYMGLSVNLDIGDCCSFQLFSVISPDVTLGPCCFVGSNAYIGTGVKIGKGVFIGPGARILDNVTIGDGAVISMASVVYRDVKPYSLMIGNPAVMLKQGKDVRALKRNF